jgi:hypothetical protein
MTSILENNLGFNIMNHSGFNNTNLNNNNINNLPNMYQEPDNSNMHQEPDSPEHGNNLNTDDIPDAADDEPVTILTSGISISDSGLEQTYPSGALKKGKNQQKKERKKAKKALEDATIQSTPIQINTQTEIQRELHDPVAVPDAADDEPVTILTPGISISDTGLEQTYPSGALKKGKNQQKKERKKAKKALEIALNQNAPVIIPDVVVGKNKRSGQSGGARKLRRVDKETDCGFTNIGRDAFRKMGGALAASGGQIRSCLPDALWMLLKDNTDITVTNDQVRSFMASDGNTPFSDAMTYVRQYGYELKRVTQSFILKGGRELAILNAKGLYLIQMGLSDDTDTPNLHCIAYNGTTLRDNDRYTKVKKLDATDRSSTENARAVFRSLFLGALDVSIHNIYQLVPM